MKNEVFNKFKDEFQKNGLTGNDIPNFINEDYLKGGNEKYMKMYNWMSRGYDFFETVMGRLKYGNQVNQMRLEIISKLEWADNLSVLYVSIGTGKDLEFIPEVTDKKSLMICGVDISLGMLKQCRKKFKQNLDLTLVNCCAEDLLFKDNTFDIVFHVGGINFFNDKQKAVDEMIRVAKNNTKILIADETNDLSDKQYKKSSFSKKYFKDAKIDLNEMESLMPLTVIERNIDILWDGKFYCMTFRK